MQQQSSFDQWRDIHRHNPHQAMCGLMFAEALHSKSRSTTEELFASAMVYIVRERGRVAA